ncbi:transglutaminase-like domain-containing protein [uncultured Microbacterium sp.]|uniref:transglutaminase-like domain-containing protein n=1 Tax=uncultured Microbacterium sp. TaxID=191216 RepID=UPI002608A76B|nr:transglutaminase-like domain-containing protein [uncultured Microbacterium sp.]
MIGAVPFDSAYNAYRDMFDLSDNGDFSATPTQYPVTTLNGDTITMPLRLDPTTISPHVVTLGMFLSGDEDAQMTGLVKGAVPGTDFRVTLYTLKPDGVSEADWPARMADYVSAYNERASMEMPKTGAVTTFADLTGSPNNVTPSTVAPVSEYELFATDELTRYIAANLAASEQAVDLSAYAGKPGLPAPADAYRTAYIQNPLISAVVDSAVIEKEILYVTYREDADAVKKIQSRLSALAEGIIAEIVDAEMSDADKAGAINAWMVDNIEYDYETYTEVSSNSILAEPVGDQWRAWDSHGALIDGLVVCGGYADAFNLLAREAGLESVYVSGNTVGGAHA